MATGEDRTEKPSAKRLRDAREKGQVPRSGDLVAAVSLLAVTVAIVRTGADSLSLIETRLSEGLLGLAEWSRASVTPESLAVQATNDGLLMARVAAPVMLAAAVAAVAGNIAQSGWVFAPERIGFDWSRLSPVNGFKRLGPRDAGLTLVKALIALTAIGVVIWPVGREVLTGSGSLAWSSPAALGSGTWEAIRRVLVRGAMALLIVGGADVGLQWWRHYRSLRMSKQELRDEARQSEGNPEIKARVRRVQRDMVRRRMMAAVPTATVVITNPTHFAVALRYERATMSAPIVVAKGQDHLAQRIKQVARDAGVPLYEHVPLAQSLYKGAEVGDAIPPALFGAVAEVLAYLVRIRQLML